MYQSNFKQAKKYLDKWELDALDEVGKFVDGEATGLCPVDTGNLKSSLRYVVDGKNKQVINGTDVEYAAAVEKGDGRQRAQPYLTPAAENNINEIEQIIKKVKYG